ncbi:MAG: ATP-binding protein [Clostridia bacterium]
MEKDSKLQRRNPLLADIFERLGYMERKGSGFGKIIDSYEFQVNYTEDKKPYFRSDRAGFVAIMPNLNYDVPQGDPQDGTIDERIIALIIKDSSISTEQMAAFKGVSAKTIKRHIKKMNNIKYVGSGYSGHGEIEE